MMMNLLLTLGIIATCSAARCPTNEIFQTCGTACESTCANPNAANGPCVEICLVNVCQCAPGFVRNPSGTCVRVGDCPKKCAKNEVFMKCGTQCETTCKKPNPICSQECKPNVCQCARGFVRQGKVCIKKNQCPK